MRVGASLLDFMLLLIGAIPYCIGLVWVIANSANGTSAGEASYSADSAGDPTGMLVGLLLILVGGLLMFGIWLWNRVYEMGRTGQSVGKKVLRLYLVSERTGDPMGVGLCFVREIVHYVDGILYLGYLWPLWDRKRQTFADKIFGTVVAQEPARHL